MPGKEHDQKRQKQRNVKNKKKKKKQTIANAARRNTENKSVWFHCQRRKLARPPEASPLVVANASRPRELPKLFGWPSSSVPSLPARGKPIGSFRVAQADTHDQQDLNCSSQHRIMTRKTPKYHPVPLALSLKSWVHCP